MASEGLIDACVHQWTTEPGKLADRVPEQWQKRLRIKSKIQDPISGSLMPTIPWYHAFWNEDSPDYEGGPDGEYTNSDQYKSPEAMEAHLTDQGVNTALLSGHVVKFISALPHPEYAAALASGYNELLKEEWLAESDVLKGNVLVTPESPESAVEEIERYADDPDMVSVQIFGGGRLPLGHDYLEPVYEAAAAADMPLTIHTSGNPINRQTALGIPEHYPTQDANLVHNHMTNVISLIYKGVFDRHPDLEVVWAGEGVSWILHTLWRATRYWRNLEGSTGSRPPELRQEPIDYLDSNFYLTTYPAEQLASDHVENLYDMAGFDNIVYGSGYPLWNHQTPDVLSALSEDHRTSVATENAQRVYGL
jgi:predicted TIM-barrel fold metal-dependent hydrolase